jgi:Ca2+:H+ antiporter
VGWSALVLAGATAVIAWISEIMVGTIEPTAHEFGLSNVFVGVFVVAIIGNAAEHATAITAAVKDRMDLSLSIAIGSSVQVALFVAPVLVLASLFGPAPLDLAFPAGLALIVFLSVLITGQVGDGRSDWLKGLQLLAVYLVLGLTFFFRFDLLSHFGDGLRIGDLDCNKIPRPRGYRARRQGRGFLAAPGAISGVPQSARRRARA